MGDPRFSEHIEGMLDVMLYLPRRAWGFVFLRDVDKRIGTAELHKIIFRACDEYGSHTLKDSNAQSRRLTEKSSASTAAKKGKSGGELRFSTH